MRRKFIDDRLHLVKKIYARFFWHRCTKCGLEFKKEYMWRVEFDSVNNCEYLYYCQSCVKSHDDALAIAYPDRKRPVGKPTCQG